MLKALIPCLMPEEVTLVGLLEQNHLSGQLLSAQQPMGKKKSHFFFFFPMEGDASSQYSGGTQFSWGGRTVEQPTWIQI